MNMMFEEQDECARVESKARLLAAQAGLVWDSFQKYPGYYRTMWREEAIHALQLDDRNAVVTPRVEAPRYASPKFFN
jgi:hypothetical protein